MPTNTNVNPTGTGQQGAGTTPAGADKDVPVHIEGGEHIDRVKHDADKAAKKGFQRQQHDDPTIFTK